MSDDGSNHTGRLERPPHGSHDERFAEPGRDPVAIEQNVIRQPPNRRPPRGIGPFSRRQVAAFVIVVVSAFIGLSAVTTPLGTTGGAPAVVDPRATAYLIGEAPAEGLRPGDMAPELAVGLPDGSTYQLQDLDGESVRLDALRGKAVWLNFWASWCPPCQQETPVIRDLEATYRDQGLAVVAVAVQETSINDIAAYAERYDLPYQIGFDGSGHILRTYRVFAIPTQFFIRPDGVIAMVINGPVERDGASALIESLLPETR